MGTCPQKVDVFAVQDRRKDGKARPWIVRWRVEGRMVSRSFRTRVEADRFRSLLVQAVTAGDPFDLHTSEPASWVRPAADVAQLTAFEWCRRWLAEQWPEWQPRTRRSAIESISRLVPLAVADEAPAPPPSMRHFLVGALEPGAVPEDADPNLRWLVRYGLRLIDLDKSKLATVELRLGRATAAPSSAQERRTGEGPSPTPASDGPFSSTYSLLTPGRPP